MKIYILKCENDKYYVGRTTNKECRIIQHFTSNGSKWTKKYKPIEIINEYNGDEFDEEKYTLITMEKYGIENVRGGSYCKVKLNKNDIEKAQQTIYSIMDKCYNCGVKGHFSKECPKKIKNKNIKRSVKNEECPACLGTGKSYWCDGITGSCLLCCCINCSKFNTKCNCIICYKCQQYDCKGECNLIPIE